MNLDGRILSEDILQRWGILLTPGEKRRFEEYIVSSNISRTTQLISVRYLTQVKTKCEWILEYELVLTSGFMYYITGSLLLLSEYENLMKIHGNNSLSTLECRVFKITMICLIIDHIIDTSDSRCRLTLKNNVIGLLSGIVDVNEVDFKLASAFHLLKELLNEVPNIKNVIMESFISEFESCKQENPDITLDELKEIETNKGSKMYQLLIVSLEINDFFLEGKNKGESLSQNLGLLLQLYDDIIDIEEDTKNGINTMVTHVFKNKGNINEIIILMLELVDTLPSSYWSFKILIVNCIIHLKEIYINDFMNIIKCYRLSVEINILQSIENNLHQNRLLLNL